MWTGFALQFVIAVVRETILLGGEAMLDGEYQGH
jgi:hypothetical protein